MLGEVSRRLLRDIHADSALDRPALELLLGRYVGCARELASEQDVFTPLLERAVEEGDEGVVRRLLKLGTSYHLISLTESDIAKLAVKGAARGSIGVSRVFLALDAKNEGDEPDDPETLRALRNAKRNMLIAAAGGCHAALMALLIGEEGDVVVTGMEGEDMVLAACKATNVNEKQQEAALKLLWDFNSDFKAANKYATEAKKNKLRNVLLNITRTKRNASPARARGRSDVSSIVYLDAKEFHVLSDDVGSSGAVKLVHSVSGLLWRALFSA